MTEKNHSYYKDGMVYHTTETGQVLALSLEAVAARLQAIAEDTSEIIDEAMVDVLRPEMVDAVPEGSICFGDVESIFSEDARCEIEDVWSEYADQEAASNRPAA